MLQADSSSRVTVSNSHTGISEKLEKDRLRFTLVSFSIGTIQLLTAVALGVLILDEFKVKDGATQGFPTFDENTKPPSTILGVRNLSGFSPLWILTLMVTITAQKHFVVPFPTVYEINFDPNRQGFNLLDWVEYLVTASLMMLTMILLTNVDEIISSMSMGIFVGFLHLLVILAVHWIPSSQKSNSRIEFLPQTAIIIYSVLTVNFLLLLRWAFSLVYLIDWSEKNHSQAPWWLYGAFVGTFFSFNALVLNFVLQRSGGCGKFKWKWLSKNPSFSQLLFNSLNLFSKLNFSLCLVIGILTHSG